MSTPSPARLDPTSGLDRMASFRQRMGAIVYGGDYNPEQWAPKVWRDDVALMRAAGVNLVSLGIFAWGSLEPREGEYTFDWLDEVMDLLHAAGISVNLATPTAAPPAWLAHDYPDTLPELADGSVYGFGNRMHYDPSSTNYRRHAAAITRAVAKRYAGHPALAMWHVNNEYGMESYSAAASERFRDWLRQRYGSLEALNDAWVTRFWGQVYSDWDQVGAPAHPRAWTNPSRKLDFARFTSDVLLECFTAERDILRELTPNIPVVTNFMRFYRRADYWRWAQEEDAVALDLYPDPAEPTSHVEAAFMYDLMRSLKGGRPWLLMEQATSAVSQWPRNQIKPPGRMRRGSLQAVAHGADAVMFFQWRASRGGSERFHSAMVPHAGTATRTWREVVGLGAELSRLGELVGARTQARVALLFDWNCWWGLSLGNLPVSDLDFREIAMRHYGPLWRANIAVDMVSTDSELAAYDLVVVPNAHLLASADRLTAYVNGGGHLLISYFSGVVDGNSRVWLDGYPGALRQLIGAHIHEYQPAGADESVVLRWADGRRTVADHWREDIHLEGATALAVFADGAVAGQPAVVDHRVGDGRVTYVGTRLDAQTMDRCVLEAVAAAGIEPAYGDSPDGLEIVRRDKGDMGWLFALNHTGTDLPWDAPAGTDALTGDQIGGRQVVPAGDALVIRLPPTAAG